MAGRPITTAAGFREAIEAFAEDLGRMAAHEAAERAEHLAGAAPIAVRRQGPDELEEAQFALQTVKNAVRRKWRALRSEHLYSGVGGLALTALTELLRRMPPDAIRNLPLWVWVPLLALGVAFSVFNLRALAECGDWKDDVGKSLDAAVATVAKERAEREERIAPYRAVAAPRESTGTRVDSTIGEQAPEPETTGGPPATAARRKL